MINVFIRLTFKAKPARNGTDIHFRVLRRKILAYILSRAIGLLFLPSGGFVPALPYWAFLWKWALALLFFALGAILVPLFAFCLFGA